MLEYSKLILGKVKFDYQLFKKEFKKAMSRLEHPREKVELRRWVRSNFPQLTI